MKKPTPPRSARQKPERPKENSEPRRLDPEEWDFRALHEWEYFTATAYEYIRSHEQVHAALTKWLDSSFKKNWELLGRVCKLLKKALPNIFVSVRKECHVTRNQIRIVVSTACGNSKFHSHLTIIVTGGGENERQGRGAGRHWPWS